MSFFVLWLGVIGMLTFAQAPEAQANLRYKIRRRSQVIDGLLRLLRLWKSLRPLEYSSLAQDPSVGSMAATAVSSQPSVIC